MKYLPLFHHFKAIYQFPKHIIFFAKIVANASLKYYEYFGIIFNLQHLFTMSRQGILHCIVAQDAYQCLFEYGHN